MSTKPRYQDRSMERVYRTMLALAADRTSELYLKNGGPRRGAGARCAFWDGFNALKRTPHAAPNTMGWACYQAGKTFARQQRHLQAACAKGTVGHSEPHETRPVRRRSPGDVS